jgi:hypothetical protein
MVLIDVETKAQSFKRCVGLSLLAYNLHILGNQLRASEEKEQEALFKKAA